MLLVIGANRLSISSNVLPDLFLFRQANQRARNGSGHRSQQSHSDRISLSATRSRFISGRGSLGRWPYFQQAILVQARQTCEGCLLTPCAIVLPEVCIAVLVNDGVDCIFAVTEQEKLGSLLRQLKDLDRPIKGPPWACAPQTPRWEVC